MNGCTETDKPLISIVMAVYEPNLQWFKEQLESLEAQSYPNLELLVIDDCSPTVPFEIIKQYVSECIRSFPYQIDRNEKNLGSNLTFEKLTRLATGKYIAYCDQDDVWLPEKLSVLEEKIEQTSAKLVCSDMYVIDGQGKQTADSITKVRRHHVFQSGEHLSEGLLFRNFVTGCTMMMPTDLAKQAIPFCPYMVHDHYLALYASLHGAIRSIMRPLIRYRIHGGNQTGVLAGVVDKKSYYHIRIEDPINKMCWLQDNLVLPMTTRTQIAHGLEWLHARAENFCGGHRRTRTIWKYRNLGPLTSIFEIIAFMFPEKIFMMIINIKRKL